MGKDKKEVLFVAEGRSVTCKKGVCGPGEEITADCFRGKTDEDNQKCVNELKEKGFLVEAKPEETADIKKAPKVKKEKKPEVKQG